VKWFNREGVQLFDLERDIGESRNLAGSMPEKAQELEALLDAWLEETGAEIPVPKGPKKK